MQDMEGHFTGAAGRTIFYRCWEPMGDPKALLLIAHGAGEHSGRYQQLAQQFCSRGFAVVALDHNGHGQSEGTPGYVEGFEDYVQDLETLRQLVVSRFAEVPLFLLGHSMGGMIAGNYLPEHQQHFAGCVMSGALVRVPEEPGLIERIMIKILAVIAPRLGVLGLDPANVSRDPEVVRLYAQDPLVFHGKMSARMVRELFAGMRSLLDTAGQLSLPLLILHGTDDVLTAPSGSQLLHDSVASQDKTLTLYPNLYHEIFNEPGGETVINEALTWCEARLAAA